MFDLHNPTAFPTAGHLRLALACILSLLFHALVFGAGHLLSILQPASAASMPMTLQATLVAPPPLPPPVLLAPDQPEPPEPPAAVVSRPNPLPTAVRRPTKATTADVTTAATRTASQQIAENLFYPPEAIANGLEGEAQVMLFLDAAGNAITARLERSSGYAILYDAAVRAARAVRSLPDAAPREVLLPVRFRLR